MAESLMYLYRATEDPQWLQIGVNMIEAIEHSAKTPCGYATVHNVKDHTIEDRSVVLELAWVEFLLILPPPPITSCGLFFKEVNLVIRKWQQMKQVGEANRFIKEQ